MESSRACESCRKRTLVPDDDTGFMVCTSCGIIQKFDNFQEPTGSITGTYIRIGTSGTGTVHDTFNMEEDCSSSSKYFEPNCLPSDCPDKFQISHECLTLIYSNYLEGISAIDVVNPRKRQKGTFDLHGYTEWWSGKSEMSKKMILKDILEKDVGLDARPPSFNRACLARAERREKIKAAKLRILRIMRPKSGGGNDLTVFAPEKARKKTRKRKCGVEIEWEDLIIETLLLHNVKEEEIEEGHYDALLDLHVFAHVNE